MKPIKTMIIKANLATIVFDSKNSELASTAVFEEKSPTALFNPDFASSMDLEIFSMPLVMPPTLGKPGNPDAPSGFGSGFGFGFGLVFIFTTV
jgi:hypothetical protein